MEVQDGRAALAEGHGMTEEKNLRRRRRLLELRSLKGDHGAERTVLDRSLEGFGVLKASGMQRDGKHGLAGHSGLGGYGQEAHAVMAAKGIGTRPKDGHIVHRVGGNDSDREQLRWPVWASQQNRRLAAVAE